ncbi:DUF6049 family protein [uncultured Schumannella sp.]|uniref:DUF6049 family protein n=1 Tax=uncultured Schumannella sp. TaxID=1195956 RepID=UPI0025F8FF9D|nr:DUF6049 family protein [uncultured Schumannella sp.]
MPLIAKLARRAAVLAATAALLAAPLSAGAAVSIGDAARAPAAGTSQLVVVVPVIVPADAPTLLDASLLEEYTAPDGLLTARLDAVEGTGATLAIDPRILASIRLLGSGVPDTAAEWLQRLESLPNDSFVLRFADVDVSGFAEVDALEVAEPLSFQFAVDTSRFDAVPEPSESGTAEPDGSTEAAPTPSTTPEPTATDEPEPAFPPTDEELTAWPTGIDGIEWPARGNLSPAGLTALGAAGSSAVLLDSASLGGSAASHLSISGTSVLASSSDLDDLLEAVEVGAFSAGSATSREAFLTVLDDELAASVGPLIVTASRDANSGTERLASLLRELTARSDLQLVGISVALQVAPSTGALTTGALDDELRAALDELLGAEAAVSRFAGIVADPEGFRADHRLDLLRSLTAGALEDRSGTTEAIAAATESAEQILDAVHIVEGSDLLVLSNSTGLPVTVSNALDVSVTVTVSGRPLRPLLRLTGGPVEVTIEPGSSHTVYLPADAVTNGEVTVLVSLRSTTGLPIGGDETLRVDLQAQWETVGTIVLIGLAVVFGSGIVHNILRRRRVAHAAETPSADTPPSDD